MYVLRMSRIDSCCVRRRFRAAFFHRWRISRRMACLEHQKELQPHKECKKLRLAMRVLQ